MSEFDYCDSCGESTGALREAITDLRVRLAEAERQRDELLDFVETVAQGKRGDCNCWVCELARLAQEAIDAAKAPDSAQIPPSPRPA